jgi:hypothetical protein
MKTEGDERIIWCRATSVDVAERRTRKDMGSGYERVIGADGKPLTQDGLQNECPRVRQRMECPECGYPFSEAMVGLDESVPHVGPVVPPMVQREQVRLVSITSDWVGQKPNNRRRSVMDRVQQRREVLDDASIAGAVLEAQRLLAFVIAEAKQPKDIGEPAEELRRLTHELDLLVPQLDVLYEDFANAYVRTAERINYNADGV